MGPTEIVIATIVIAVLGGVLAIWFRRRQKP
jgi:hypothetical protein